MNNDLVLISKISIVRDHLDNIRRNCHRALLTGDLITHADVLTQILTLADLADKALDLSKEEEL